MDECSNLTTLMPWCATQAFPSGVMEEARHERQGPLWRWTGLPGYLEPTEGETNAPKANVNFTLYPYQKDMLAAMADNRFTIIATARQAGNFR